MEKLVYEIGSLITLALIGALVTELTRGLFFLNGSAARRGEDIDVLDVYVALFRGIFKKLKYLVDYPVATASSAAIAVFGLISGTPVFAVIGYVSLSFGIVGVATPALMRFTRQLAFSAVLHLRSMPNRKP